MVRTVVLLAAIVAAFAPACGASTPPPPAPAVEPASGEAELRVAIEGLRDDQGIVRAALFSSADGFPGEVTKAVRRKAVSITEEGTAQLHFTDLAPGYYGLAVVHDANANGEIDTNFIGIPVEGVGASNNPRPRMGPPTFEDARFSLPPAGKSITVSVTYI